MRRETFLRSMAAAALAPLALPVLREGARAEAPTLRPGGTRVSGGLQILAGSFHNHSTDSDGDASPKAIAKWLYTHRQELGIDFAGLCDHSDFWPFTYREPFGPSAWKKQARIGDQYASLGFPFIRGFEYTSDEENHVSVLGASSYLKGLHQGDLSMSPLYRWLAGRDAISIFNHPSAKGALQWDDLAFASEVADNFAAIEIGGQPGFDGASLAQSDAGWYWLALTRGWTVSPVMNWDMHHWRRIFRQTDVGVRGGDATTLPCQRTLVLAEAATPEAIAKALAARRTSATEHPSLWATLRAPGGLWQGGTVTSARAGQTLSLTVEAGSTIWPLESVEIISDNGVDPHGYYDGENSAHLRRSGPYALSYLEQHRRFAHSCGCAVRKAPIDGPPENTTIASVPLRGDHALRTIDVTIPNTPSLRPDGKHFFYAIVRAGQLRAWTAPIFTDDGTLRASVPRPAQPAKAAAAPSSSEATRTLEPAPEIALGGAGAIP